MLFVAVRAHAQSTNNDNYGLAPIPGVPQTPIQPGDPEGAGRQRERERVAERLNARLDAEGASL